METDVAAPREWAHIEAAKTALSARNLTAGEELGLKYVQGELRLLANIVCRACDGYGHTQKDCPTAKMLSNFGDTGSRIDRVLHDFNAYHRVVTKANTLPRSSMSRRAKKAESKLKQEK